MRTMRRRVLGIVTAIILLLAAVAWPVAVKAVEASAEAPVQTSLGAFNVEALYAAGDTSVTAGSCNPGDHVATSLKTVEDGIVSGQVKRQGMLDWYAPICGPSGMTVARDGTVYVYQAQDLGLAQNRRLAAYRGGELIHAPQAVEVCEGLTGPGRWGELLYPTEGADNSLYFLAGGNVGCEAPQAKLVALNTDTGEVKFTVPLLAGGGGQGEPYAHIFPSRSGFAVLDGPTLRFFGLDGSEQVNSRKPVEGARIVETRSNGEGRIYLRLNPVTPVVNDCKADTEIIYYDINGSSGTITTDNCVFKTGSMAPAPGDGLVLMGGRGDGPDTFDDRLIKYDAAGKQVFSRSLNRFDVYSEHKVGRPRVDSHGNTVLLSTGKHGSTGDEHVVVSVVDPTGADRTIVFTTLDWSTEAYDNFRTGMNFSLALTPGRAHIATCHYNQPTFTSCSEAADVSLTSIPVVGLGAEYPASDFMKPLARYAALGDGYAAGDGVPGFIPPSGENGCHRSNRAFARQLADDSGLGLGLRAFVACSGSTTSDIINGGLKEGESQLKALDEPTSLVTLTAGASDVGYREFLRTCVSAGNCLQAGLNGATMRKIESELPGRLDALYAAIKARAGVNGATRVLVVGYPTAVTDPRTETLCADFTNPERNAAMHITASLNASVRTAVERAGAPFEFVDAAGTDSPFATHLPCTADSYFNDNGNLPAVVMFPDEEGQAAYARLLRSRLVKTAQ